MPMYEYRCPNYHVESITCSPTDPRKATMDSGAFNCLTCELPLKRVFSFTTPTFFTPHYNHSAGAYVETKRQLDEQMKVASEAATLRTGLEHKFVAHDVRDVKPEDFGVTDDGLKETHDTQVATGIKESKGRFTF